MTELQLPAAPKTVLFPAKSPTKRGTWPGKNGKSCGSCLCCGNTQSSRNITRKRFSEGFLFLSAAIRATFLRRRLETASSCVCLPLPTHGFPSLLSASEGSVQLDCLGGIQDKITVCATDDSYQKARESMAQVEEETRSRSAIVIKPGGRYVGEKTRRGLHTPCTCHFGFTGVQRPFSSLTLGIQNEI